MKTLILPFLLLADVLANFPANFRDMGGNGYAKAGLTGQEETK